jgi:hypothetical protein
MPESHAGLHAAQKFPGARNESTNKTASNARISAFYFNQKRVKKE